MRDVRNNGGGGGGDGGGEGGRGLGGGEGGGDGGSSGGKEWQVVMVVVVVDSAVVGEVDSVAGRRRRQRQKILHNFHPRIARLLNTPFVSTVADIWMNEGNTYLHQDRPDLRSKYLEWKYLPPPVFRKYSALPPHVVVQIRRIDFERSGI